MHERLYRRLRFSKKIILTLILVSIPLVSCGPQLQSIRIVSAWPLENTCHACYPDIKKVYQSDKEVILVSSWRSSGSSEGNRIRWEIWSPKSELAYSTQDEKVNILRNSSYSQPIRFDENVREKYTPGVYTIKLYLDNQLIKSQAFEYFDESIINTSLNGAVILPFSFRGPGQLDRKPYLNTTTHAIYGEVKRIVEETIPPAIAAYEIGAGFSPEDFKNPYKMSSVKEVFPEDILISGILQFSELISDTSMLTVYVHSSKTGTNKQFRHIEGGGKRYYRLVLADLIKGVLYEQGLLDYLRTL